MDESRAFEVFFTDAEPVVRRALVSRFGAELGRDATAEGFAVAWSSWKRVRCMENSAGYVYRTAERWAARQESRRERSEQVDPTTADLYRDDDLAAALQTLSPKQRQAVVLVQAFGMSHREAADFLGCSRSTVQNHVERGMKRLRENLEVRDHA